MASTETPVPDTPFSLGSDGVAEGSALHAGAWIGLLETHKQLTRALDAELDAKFGLSLSELELLGRLGAAPERCLRLTSLAAACGLSLSRVSRLAAGLERRGLLERRPCADDGRAVEAHLTATGLALLRDAQEVHFASVKRAFFDHLDESELRTLSSVFARLALRSPGAGGAASPA
jgi:DNA-binding MarR family transcriptional regulator